MQIIWQINSKLAHWWWWWWWKDDDDDSDQDAGGGLEDARVKMVPKPCRTIPHPTQLCTIAPHKVLHNRCRYLCSAIHCWTLGNTIAIQREYSAMLQCNSSSCAIAASICREMQEMQSNTLSMQRFNAFNAFAIIYLEILWGNMMRFIVDWNVFWYGIHCSVWVLISIGK